MSEEVKSNEVVEAVEVEEKVEAAEVTEVTEVDEENEVGMEDLMDSIDESMKKVNHGDIVEGEIISVNEDELLVNIGYISDGIVTSNELSNEDVNPLDLYKEGDKITVMVVKTDDGEGNVVLSKKRADNIKVWDEFEASLNGTKLIKVKVKEAVKGGVTAEVKGVRVFIPASHLSINYVEELSEFVGKEFKAKVIDLDLDKNRVVLSRKVVEAKEAEEKKAVLMETLEVDAVLEGTVSRLANFGAFVNIGGVDGLVHISELSWKRLKHPSEVVTVGDVVKVAVNKIDKENGKISLRLQDVKGNPWDDIYDHYNEEDIIEGTVVRLATFGAFVQLQEGVDGLVHISQISNERVNKPSDVLNVGDAVKVMITNIDVENKRIGLSMKALLENEGNDVDFEEFLTDENEEEGATLADLFGDKLKDFKF